MAKHIMGFSESVAIDRRPEEVFEKISDLPALFSKLRKKTPIDIERLSGAGAANVGDAWRVSGKTRLGHRTGTVEITGMSSPHHLSFHSVGRGFSVDTVVTLSPVGATGSQLTAANELFAETFAARLLAPGIRLGHRRVTKGLKKGLRRLKKRLET